jgi:hypothetical protein
LLREKAEPRAQIAALVEGGREFEARALGREAGVEDEFVEGLIRVQREKVELKLRDEIVAAAAAAPPAPAKPEPESAKPPFKLTVYKKPQPLSKKDIIEKRATLPVRVAQRLPLQDLQKVTTSPSIIIDGVPAVVAEDVPDSLLGRQIVKTVAMMNQKHAIIGNVGGKYRILEWVPSEFDENVLVPSFQTQDDFKNRYSDLVATDNGLVKQGEIWLRNSRRARYDQIAFRPGDKECIINQVGNVTTTIMNLWRGFAVQPVKGDWSRLRWHIEHILSAGDQRVYNYILDWSAAGFQRPGVKRRVALVFIGPEGVGKGIFGHALIRVYGRHGVYIAQPSHLTGNFNNHLWFVCLVFADEAIWAGNREAEQALKSLISDDRLMIELKGVNSFPAKNHLDYIFASNNDWAVPVQKRGRRYAAFGVDPRYGKGYCSEADRAAYFGALLEEMQNGGLAAMLHDLLERDISGWNPENFPVTDALRKQKRQTLRGYDRAFEGWLQFGSLPRDYGGWMGRPDCATTTAMVKYVRSLRGSEYETDDALKDYLREWQFAGTGDQLIDTNWRVPGGGARGAKFPALADCRAAFAADFGDGAWPWDETVTDWTEIVPWSPEKVKW